jgi:hypothetical protein
MQKKLLWGSVMAAVAALALAAYFGTGTSQAQVKVKQGVKQAPVVKPMQLCQKPDLAQWKDNLPLGTKDEFPFEGPCKACLLKLGAMNLPTMLVWVTNKGMTDAPASKAKLSWKSAKAPYTMQSVVANVPAIAAGGQYLVTVTPPQNNFFQISSPITLEVDSAHSIDECNENNNTMSFTYH